MALDEAHQRLFIFCRDRGYVAVLDTGTGRRVTTLRGTPGATSDDMFWDPGKDRLYVLARILFRGRSPHVAGPGIVEVIQEEDPDHFKMMATTSTGFGAQTGMFVPQWGELFVAARQQPGERSAEILEYDTK